MNCIICANSTQERKTEGNITYIVHHECAKAVKEDYKKDLRSWVGLTYTMR